jgi:ADP-ribose pyrophosphatase
VQYTSPWMDLVLLDVGTPDGRRYEHHVARLPPSAMALVLDDEDRVLLLWKYRVVIDRWGYELPGGMIDAGEDAVTAAARECAEETGWSPRGEPELLFTLEPLPGQVVAPCAVYRWGDAAPTGGALDPEETGDVEWVPLEKIPALVGDGSVMGAATLGALLAVACRVGATPGRSTE